MEKQEDTSEIRKGYRRKEFLLHPQIWNSMDAFDANSPIAGGRFSAAELATTLALDAYLTRRLLGIFRASSLREQT